jgi:hypothetical protein
MRQQEQHNARSPQRSALAAAQSLAAAASSSAAPDASDAFSPSAAAAAIDPLPEQSLGRKRARHSPRAFSWLSVLATVEVQLVLRCLDIRSRLTAARCKKLLYVASNHPFAWPQEQLMTLRVSNDPDELQTLGGRVRASLLRLAVIHVLVQLPSGHVDALRSEIFAVPNVQSITVVASDYFVAIDFFLPVLRHPSARQLRSFDISSLWRQRCSAAELQQLQVLSHLHSLSLGTAACRDLSTLAPLSLLPSLTHLSIAAPDCRSEQRLYPPLSQCVGLVSLRLDSATVCSALIDCLGKMPLLQRLHLTWSCVDQHSAHFSAGTVCLRVSIRRHLIFETICRSWSRSVNCWTRWFSYKWICCCRAPSMSGSIGQFSSCRMRCRTINDACGTCCSRCPTCCRASAS